MKPPTIRQCFVLLSAVFTTALNDQVTFLHPCKGVKTPPVPAQPRTIITPEQFAALYACLPDAQSKLLVETAVESGLRWGELSELRVRDLDFTTRMLTVSRAVVQVDPQFHPDGGRFLVKGYPKDKEYRRFKLSAQITAKLRTHVVEHELGRDDLLFQAPVEEEPRVLAPRLNADPDGLGHSSLRTTEKYLHTLPDADETALDALSKMRNRALAV